MQEFSLKGAPGVRVSVRRSARARRISLRVSSLDGRVTLTLPRGASERAARAFAEEKARWLEGALGKVRPVLPVGPGSVLPVAGIARQVVAGGGRAARLTETTIEAPAGREGPAIEALLRHLARAALAEATGRHAAALGVTPGGLTLRDTRSRWGSCSSEGNLMFSWRLIMAPPRVLDYVAAHEVAHLRHMDHSAAFWATVETLFPAHKAERRWLKEQGNALHRHRFRAAD